MVALLLVAPGATVQGQSDWIAGRNLVRPPNLPVMGKWMLAADGAPAHWMGQTYQGKHLREPINVIIIDRASTSASQASTDLLAAATAAGYAVRMGHSTGYQAYLGDQLHPQIPRGWDDALSNEPFEFSNNHGRLFGPYETAGGHILIGAFSREAVNPFRRPGHQYASFNEARDDFARRLDKAVTYRMIGYVALENAIAHDPVISTGDHDGNAVLLRRIAE